MKTAAKGIGFCFFVVALLWLSFVWAELALRRYLYFSYGSQPYLNHVDDSYFVMLPARAHFGTLCAGAAAAFAAIFRYPRLTVVCLLLAASGWSAPRLLDYYHRTLVLVTYKEFAEAEFGDRSRR